MEDRDSMRAADKDRDAVAERLREALTEGRLTFDEYDERLKDVYAAKTYGDLKAPLADLPAVAPVASSQVVSASSAGAGPVGQPPHGSTGQWIAAQWSGWVTLAAILTTVWALTSWGGYFWPMWPLGVLGAINIAQTVSGLGSGAPRRHWEHEQRKAAERAARRERRVAERDMHGHDHG